MTLSTTVDLVEDDVGAVRLWLHGRDRGRYADVTVALAAVGPLLGPLVEETARLAPDALCDRCCCPISGADCAQCQVARFSIVHSGIEVFPRADGLWLLLSGELFGPFETFEQLSVAAPACLTLLAFEPAAD